MADRMVNLLTTLLAYIKNKSLMTASSSYWLWDWVFFLLINYLKLYLILAEGVINTQNVQKISVCKTTYQNCQWCFISTQEHTSKTTAYGDLTKLDMGE